MDKLIEKIASEIWVCSINLQMEREGCPIRYLPDEFREQRLIDKTPYYETTERIKQLFKGYVKLSANQELLELKHSLYFKKGIKSNEDLLKFAQAIELSIKTEVLKDNFRRVELW